jgi:type IV secretory pathway VirB9-like protein
MAASAALADVEKDVKAITGGENLAAVTKVDMGNVVDIRAPETSVNMRSTQEKFFHIEGKETIKNYKWEKNKLIKVNTRVFMESMIVLPEYERIVTLYSGDKRFFKFSRPEFFPYMLAIQATEEAIDTSLQVITESGRIYLFYVRSLPIKTSAVPDLLVYIEAPQILGGQMGDIGNAGIISGGETIHNTNISSNRIRQSNSASQNKYDYLHSLVDPKKVNGAYKITGDKDIAPQAVYDDGAWTYFDFRNIPSSMDRPSVYRVTDKKQTLVNSRRIDGHYVAETLSNEGWMLQLGNKIVCIKSEKSHNFNVR